MALPKRRISRARGRKRRSANMRLAVPTLVECSNCGNRIMPHRVCSEMRVLQGKADPETRGNGMTRVTVVPREHPLRALFHIYSIGG